MVKGTEFSEMRISWLRVAREARRLTQRDLAELSGLSRVAISHIETHRANPRFSSQRALAKALQMKAEEVFPPPGKPSSSPELRVWARAIYGGERER